MHPRWLSLASLALVFFSLVSSSPSLLNDDLSLHHVGTHLHRKAAPLLEIDEAQVLSNHQPSPPSYYSGDWEDDGHQSRHGSLMFVHAVFMSLAFFVLWPTGGHLISDILL